MREESYETPAIAEAGEFAELTQAKNAGNYLDQFYVQAWWYPFD